jgi:excisionase family DNA binding protein
MKFAPAALRGLFFVQNFSKTLKVVENPYIKPCPAMGIFKHGGGGMETYLTIAELAEYIKLAEQTVRRYVLNKTVPYHKIHKAVRFRVSEIEKWIDGGGLDGAVMAEPEDNRGTATELRSGEGSPLAGDLFACLDAAETGEAGTETGAVETEAGTAVEEGDNTGGAA